MPEKKKQRYYAYKKCALDETGISDDENLSQDITCEKNKPHTSFLSAAKLIARHFDGFLKYSEIGQKATTQGMSIIKRERLVR